MRSIFIVILVIFSLSVHADGDGKTNQETNNYSISGIVKDKLTGEELPGVAIKIHSSGETVYSDLEGRFEFSELTHGNYDLTAEYISYEEIIFHDIRSVQNLSSDLIIQLEKKKPIN